MPGLCSKSIFEECTQVEDDNPINLTDFEACAIDNLSSFVLIIGYLT